MFSDRIPPHELRRLEAAADADPIRLDELVAQRLAGEPLQYLEGTAAFGPFDLLVDQRVLIPRPETEELWELARSLAPAAEVIVDLCTGSGALAIALKSSHPDARVFATELSPGAVEVARQNVVRWGMMVEVLEGDLFEPLSVEFAGRVSLVVANPPYVAASEWTRLPVDVKREPQMALVAGEKGTEILERIAREVGRWLAPAGRVVCEIGETQAAWALSVFGEAFAEVEIRRDLSGRDRFVTCIKR